MPMPKPKKGENKKEYISRFMADKKMKEEYPSQKQRYAVASTRYSNKKGKK